MVLPEISDKPLTEELLREKPREFIKTWSEWAADNFEQINKSTSRTSGGTSVIFTVPDKNTLFITSAWISGIGSSAGVIVNFKITTTALSNLGDVLRVFSNDINGASLSQTFPSPLKLEAGEILSLTIATGQGSAGAGIQGFLIPKRIS